MKTGAGAKSRIGDIVHGRWRIGDDVARQLLVQTFRREIGIVFPNEGVEDI
jgi:hypothetical protein